MYLQSAAIDHQNNYAGILAKSASENMLKGLVHLQAGGIRKA